MTYDLNTETYGHGGSGAARRTRTARQKRMAYIDTPEHRCARVFRFLASAVWQIGSTVMMFVLIWEHLEATTPYLIHCLEGIGIVLALHGLAYIADGRWSNDEDDGRG